MEKKTFKPEIESLVKIQAYVKEGIRKHTDADQNWFKLDLVIEELVVNIISYGMKDIESGVIEVGVELSAEGVHLQISDNAEAFNPLEKEDPDICTDIKNRNPGGLGIFLVKQIAKKIKYVRKDNKNYLHLWLA